MSSKDLINDKWSESMVTGELRLRRNLDVAPLRLQENRFQKSKSSYDNRDRSRYSYMIGSSEYKNKDGKTENSDEIDNSGQFQEMLSMPNSHRMPINEEDKDIIMENEEKKEDQIQSISEGDIVNAQLNQISNKIPETGDRGSSGFSKSSA